MTLEPTTCVVVSGANVRDFLAGHPDFALHLIRKLIGLVRRSTDTVKRLALDDVYTRVSKLLLRAGLRTRTGAWWCPSASPSRTSPTAWVLAGNGQPHLQAADASAATFPSRRKRIVLLKKLPARW
jgi:CRP/FNR family cyclic AMP-dependent transcriptional regulator